MDNICSFVIVIQVMISYGKCLIHHLFALSFLESVVSVPFFDCLLHFRMEHWGHMLFECLGCRIPVY